MYIYLFKGLSCLLYLLIYYNKVYDIKNMPLMRPTAIKKKSNGRIIGGAFEKNKSPGELAPRLHEIVTTTRAICSGYLVL